MSGENEKKEKTLRCVVVSDKMNKTRVGRVDRMVKHAGVGKYLRKSTRVMFHDDGNKTKVGDEVLLRASRPLSGKKSFSLDSVIAAAKE